MKSNYTLTSKSSGTDELSQDEAVTHVSDPL